MKEKPKEKHPALKREHQALQTWNFLFFLWGHLFIYFLFIFWRGRLCWPLWLCRLLCIFKNCLSWAAVASRLAANWTKLPISRHLWFNTSQQNADTDPDPNHRNLGQNMISDQDTIQSHYNSIRRLDFREKDIWPQQQVGKTYLGNNLHGRRRGRGRGS